MRPVATGAEKLVPQMVRMAPSLHGRRDPFPPRAANSTREPSRVWMHWFEALAEKSTATTLVKCAGQTRTEDPPLLHAATTWTPARYAASIQDLKDMTVKGDPLAPKLQ